MKFHNQNRRPSAYEHYRQTHPNTVFVGAELTEFQKNIAERFTNAKDEKYFVWAASRQSGKSFLSLQLLLHTALNRKNTVSMFVSMTYSQTLKVFNELISAVKGSGVISSYSKADHEVQFINGSQVLFKSYQNPDSCRGYHISGLLVIDEAAWMSDGDFETIFLPMLQNHRQSKCLIISSPRGTNWFHTYYNRGLRLTRMTNKSVISFRSTYEDNPFSDKSEIEELRKSIPDAIFRQEYLAEFISGATSAFGETYKKCLKVFTSTYDRNTRYVGGIDVGREEDYSVLTIMDILTGKVVETLRLRHTTFDDIANKMVEIILKWRPVSVLCEVNGVGNPFFELLQNKLAAKNYYDLKPFTTTNTSKNNIIEALKIDFENETVILPDTIEYREELEGFEVNYSSKSKSVVYGARNGLHDDLIMSLAICNWARRTQSMKGNYAIA